MKLAIILPCFNESMTIAKVIADCRASFPEAEICVFDNRSMDSTAVIARRAGAQVFHVANRGKGNVIRSALAQLNADIFLILDGDDTYPPEDGRALVEQISQGYDMCVGNRLKSHEGFSSLHRFGNILFSWLAAKKVGFPVSDLLSGMRALSKNFARTTQLQVQEFEIETELTLTAIANRYKFCERPIGYRHRPMGSRSKLRTFRDGWRILKFILFFQPIAQKAVTEDRDAA